MTLILRDLLGVYLIAICVISVSTQTQTATTITPPITNTPHLSIENPTPQKSSLEKLQRKDNNVTVETLSSETNSTHIAVTLTSKNYPNPYPGSSFQNWTIAAENATGFEIVIYSLDIESTTDYLKIHLGETDDADQEDAGLILTGKLSKPLQLRSPYSPELRIEFSAKSTQGHSHRGFNLSYTPFGEIPDLTTKPPTEVPISPELTASFTALLTVFEQKQNNETWSLFRKLLCEATNNYTAKHNLTLEDCHSENVTFVSISRCSNLWPNNVNCLEIEFNILLMEKVDEGVAVTEDPLNGVELIFPKELTAEHLQEMWTEFGEDIFKARNFPTYTPPKASGLILFWTGMSLAAIVVFVLILIIISRLQILKSVVKWPTTDEDNQNILKNPQDIDITMFPSPHQIVPTLFPSSTSAYSPGSSFLYGGDVYENRPRDALDCFNETDPSLLSGLRRDSMFGFFTGMDAPTLQVNGNDDRIHQQQESYGKISNQDESVS